MSERIQPGQVVLSRAGRDSGRLFVVIRREGEFVWLADGDLRPLERPKKKKLRHLGVTTLTLQGPVESDRQLRRLLARMETDDQDEEE